MSQEISGKNPEFSQKQPGPESVQKREKILQSLFNDPYLQIIAKRVRQKTAAVPVQWRSSRQLIIPEKKAQNKDSVTSAPTTSSQIFTQMSKIDISEQNLQTLKPTSSHSDTKKVVISQDKVADFLDYLERSETKKFATLEKSETKKNSSSNLPPSSISKTTLEQANRPATDSRRISISSDNLANFLESLELQEREVNSVQPSCKEDVSWVLSTLSEKIHNISEESFVDLVSTLKKNTDKSSQQSLLHKPTQITQDIQEYAKKLKISAADLYAAMAEEKIANIQQLYEAFQDMCSPSSSFTLNYIPEFDIFVKGLVDSYRDRKNEEALLGLIGVSANTGKQNLSTAYARLLAEIFKVDIGGFFLKNTQNPNYNAFNLGNMIQKQLLELDEINRVSYLENILTLLKDRNNLLVVAREVTEQQLKGHYITNLFSEPNKLIDLVEKYLADLGIFQLGLFSHEELPDDIVKAAPEKLDDLLKYATGFPKNLVQKQGKLIFMFQKLYDNQPMVFNVLT